MKTSKKPTRGLAILIGIVAVVIIVTAWRAVTQPVMLNESGATVEADWPDMRVDINRAGIGELRALPTIGPARARTIITHREEHGEFSSVSELDDVHGIGPKTIDEIAPFIVVEKEFETSSTVGE